MRGLNNRRRGSRELLKREGAATKAYTEVLLLASRRDRIRSSGIIDTCDAKAAHLVLEGSSLEPQTLRRSAFAGYPSGRVFQSVDDDLPLGLLEGRG